MGRKAHIFPGFSSGPLLGYTYSRGPGTDWLVLKNRFGLGQGGGFDEWTRPPYDGLFPDVKCSVHLPKTPKGFCPVVVLTRGSFA